MSNSTYKEENNFSFNKLDKAAVENLEIHFTKDPDEIEEVFVNGPETCMGGNSQFDTNNHPAIVYGNSPDVSLCYLGTPELPKARTIIHDEKKLFTYVYGDYSDALVKKLEELGYSYSCEFGDVRLRYIDDGDDILCPYIDFGNSGEVRYDDELQRRFFVIMDDEHGEYDIRPTEGYISEPRRRCIVDKKYYDDEDVIYLNFYDEYVAKKNIDDNFFVCEGDEEYHLIEEKRRVYGSEGMFSFDYIEENLGLGSDFESCPETGAVYLKGVYDDDDFLSTIDDNECLKAILWDNEYVRCSISGKFMSETDERCFVYLDSFGEYRYASIDEIKSPSVKCDEAILKYVREKFLESE